MNLKDARGFYERKDQPITEERIKLKNSKKVLENRRMREFDEIKAIYEKINDDKEFKQTKL